MNDLEHKLTCLAEECSEVAICANEIALAANQTAQRATKALRFGLEDVQPEQLLTNGQRLIAELNDLMGAVELLIEKGVIEWSIDRKAVEAKKDKIKKYLVYSKECGTLQGATDESGKEHPYSSWLE
jgi:hypothetical protein